MKNLSYLILSLSLLAWSQLGFSQSQESVDFPSRGLSLNLGSLVFHSLISTNFEKYKHSPNNSNHWGIGCGVSLGGGFFGRGIGGHILGTYWSGKKKDHFQASLGVAPTYFTGGDYEDPMVSPVPIVLVGYRRQAPGSGSFFVLHIGSVGLGFGFGKAF